MIALAGLRLTLPEEDEKGQLASRHRRVGYLPSLTGVRGAAAVWVFSTHFYVFSAQVLHMPWILKCSFFFNGFHGVDLFFILSGFILMHVHASDFVKISQEGLKIFFITRFFRVYPLNTVVLLALVPLVFLAPSYVTTQRSFSGANFAYRAHNLSFPGFIQTLLLAQSWTILKLGEWNIVSWTLSAEILGYILFPAIAWFVARQNSWRCCTLLAFTNLTILTGILFLFHHANNDPTGIFGSVRMFFCFVAGVALFRCHQLLPNLGDACASWTTILALISIAITMFFPVAPVLDSFGFAALIFGLAYRQGPVNAVLESRLAMFLGKISFSFYLTHFLLIGITSWAIGDWLVAQSLGVRIASVIALIAVCLLLAVLLYYAVERPSQRFGHDYIERHRLSI